MQHNSHARDTIAAQPRIAKDQMPGVIDGPAPMARLEAVIATERLQTIAFPGGNPGNLSMRLFVPKGPSRRRPLVVVLHGCAQTALGYDAASGWSRLAETHDFLVLYPEQRVENNSQSCFSWFQPGDIERGGGEVESIHEMIETAVAAHAADPRAIYICGLSAGGAMSAAMLATYPELFCGGAIIAGLPFGTARNLSEAYESMSSGKVKDARIWGDFVRGASAHAGPWPSVAIWHGTDDRVVRPINAGELVKQWTNVHGLGAEIPAEDRVGKVARRIWRDASGRPCVSDYCVPAMGHGAPVDDQDPPAPFFLPVGISSTLHIAEDWGLTARTKPRRLLAMIGL